MTKKVVYQTEGEKTIMVVTPKGKRIFMTWDQYDSHEGMKAQEERKNGS